MSGAAKVWQRVIGAGVDGEIGIETVKLARAADAVHVVNAVCDERLAFLKNLRTWPRFGRGWARRVSDVRATALKMAAAAPAKDPGKSSGGIIAAIVGALLAMFRRAPAKPPGPPAP